MSLVFVRCTVLLHSKKQHVMIIVTYN